MGRRKIPWSELPPELLTSIAQRLESRNDVHNFRSVCKNWLESAPQPKTLLSPLLPCKIPTRGLPILPPKYSGDPSKLRPRILAATSIYMLRSSQHPDLPPWLVCVEELHPGKLFLRQPFSRLLLVGGSLPENRRRSTIRNLVVGDSWPENLPKVLNLSDFQVSEVGTSYNVRFGDDVGKWVEDRYWDLDNKAVLFLNPNYYHTNNKTIDDYTAMVLFDEGTLVALRLKNGDQKMVTSGHARKFDDIVNFRGKIYAIDRKGRAYSINYHSLKASIIVDHPLGDCKGCGGEPKKRLVESGGELYLVYRYQTWELNFEVYRLNEELRRWDEEVEGIGEDRLLFVSFDGCFFASREDFPGWEGNSILLHRLCFPSYSNVWHIPFELEWTKELEVKLFHFDTRKSKRLDYSSYSEYSVVFWPPPAWLSPDVCSSHRGTEEDGRLGNDTLHQQSPESSSMEYNTIPCGSEAEKQGDEHECFPEAHIHEDISMDDVEDLGITSAMQDKMTNVLDSAPSSSSSDTSEYVGSAVSKVRFEGVEVSSDVVPTLTRIWQKHGNILQGHVAHSDGLVAWALESLAKVVIVLQNCTSKSLTDSQADFLSSTLLDLKLMHLNINWLVPSVEKALKIRKAMAGRVELEDSLAEIDKVASQVEEVRRNFLAELSGLERILNEQRKNVYESLSVLGQVDQDEYVLGEGLC